MAYPTIPSNTKHGTACNAPFTNRTHVAQFPDVSGGVGVAVSVEKVLVLLVLVLVLLLTSSAEGPYQ